MYACVPLPPRYAHCSHAGTSKRVRESRLGKPTQRPEVRLHLSRFYWEVTYEVGRKGEQWPWRNRPLSGCRPSDSQSL